MEEYNYYVYGRYSLWGIFLLALVLAPFLLVGYLMETYPVIALIVSLAGIVLQLYLLYRIVRFLYRAIHRHVLKMKQKRALE